MSVTEEKKRNFLLHLEAKTRTNAAACRAGRCTHLAADLIAALADLNAALVPQPVRTSSRPRTEAKTRFFLL
jgi:hypothetical protein